jgi:hypothetical protein
MAQFDLKISELERLILLYALGGVSQKTFPDVVPLVQRLALLANGESIAPGPRVDPPPAAVMEAAPVSPHEPARSLDSDVQERTFTADSITKVGNRLVIKWQARDKILQASCWESALFPAVLRCVKREATFLLKAVKKGNATYLNVVGVK